MLLLLLLTACQGGGDTEQVSQAREKLLLDASHAGGAAWGLADCAACHVLDILHKNADNLRGIAQAKGYASCAGCHGGNGTDTPRQCLICHNATDLPAAPLQDGAHAHGFGKAALGDEDCLSCHLASDMDGRFEPNTDLTRYPDLAGVYTAYDGVSPFCLRCHNRDHQQRGFEIAGSGFDDPLIAAEDHYRYIDKHGEVDGSGARTYAGLRAGYRYRSVVECTDCHAMHGTANAGLVIDRSDKGLSRLDAAVREVPYSVDTANGDFGQLCVLCHRMETVLEEGDQDTGNGLAGVHAVGQDCRPCHSHGEAVQAGM